MHAPPQPYGDLTALNTNGLILRSVGADVLGDIVEDYLGLLGTSAAVYEKNGEYAAGIFSSGWCRRLDAESRGQCGTADNAVALGSGRWHCHESCWKTSRQSIETGQAADLECDGGIRIYAVPIVVRGRAVGSINFGYGDPPRAPDRLAPVAARYGVPVEELQALAADYESRQAFVIDAAKTRLRAAARLIASIVERREAETALQASERRLRSILDQVPVSIWESDWTAAIGAVEALRAQGVTDFSGHFARYPEQAMALLRQVRIVDVNPETMLMFGARDKSDLLASFETVVATPETLPGFVGQLVALAAGEPVYRAEMALRTVHGALMTVLLTMTFPAPGSGSGTVLVSLMDITARVEAETKLRQLNDDLEARVRERTAALQAAVVDVERQHTLLEAIETAQTQFLLSSASHDVFDGLLEKLLVLAESEYGFIDELCYTPEGRPYLIARAITDISWNEETRTLYDQFRAGRMHLSNPHSLFGVVMTTGETVIANDAPNDPRRGGIPPGHPPLNTFLGVPLRSSGEFVGVLGLANRPGGYSSDLIDYLQPLVASCGHLVGAWKTDQQRRAAEAALLTANARLEASNRGLEVANRELDTFCYSVSHDLRAPVRAIDGYAQILIEDHGPALDDDAQHALEVIQGETRRMSRLIDDLLAYSRTSRAGMAQTDVDMTRLAREEWARVVDGVENAPDVALDALPPAQGDLAMIRQIWHNLLHNAVKFSRAGPRPLIDVGYRQADGGAYYVRDNGVGFDTRFADKLFQPFQRLHSEEEFEGTGVGLALVRRIVERHGGRIWADAVPGGGATFYFTLPGQKGIA